LNKTAQILLLSTLSLSILYAEAQRVDFIEYRVLNVFEENGEYWGPYDYRWVYSVLNDLHLPSRPATVKRFLAFGIGDTINAEIISESERRLRATDFIGEAEIQIQRCDSGNVAVVTVTDLWTTKLAPSLAYKGRVLEWSLEVEEVNLAGIGVNIRGAFEHDEDYDSWLFGAQLPRMLPGGASFKFFHSNETKTVGPTSTSLSVSKGLRRDTDKLIYSAGAFRAGGVLPTWSDGNTRGESYRIDDETQYFGAKYLFTPKFGLGLGMRSARLSREIEADDATPCFEQEYDIIAIGASYLRRNYIADRDVDAFGRTEDLPLGWLVAAESGVSGDFELNYNSASLAHSSFVGENYFATKIYYHKICNTESLGGSLRFSSAMFLSGRLCGRIAYQSVNNGFPETLYRVGGQSVLRSYRSYAQVGERTAYGNLEWRIFTPLEIFSVRFGGAVFVDAGTAWDRADGDLSLKHSPKPLLGDVGLELRLGSTSSTTGQIARVAVARAFDGTWELSLSAGQMFETYFGFEHGVPIP